MTSMLCRKEKGGQVLVHDTGLIDILKIDNNDQITRMVSKQRSAHRRRMPRPNTTPSPVRIRSASSGNMDSKCLIGQTMKVQDWLNEKTLKTLQEKSDLESKAVRKLYSPILETEDTFVKEVEQFINQKDLSNLRKKEVLHKNWNERVYKPLRKKIIEAMDGDDWPEVDRRKRELHRQYLEFNNDKGHVFLDTMDPEEYYALALNGHRPAPIKIETRRLQDPLISQSRHRNEEERTILRCLTGYQYTDRDIQMVKGPIMPLIPLGRHGTNSVRWLEMPLSNIESTPRLASRKRMQGIFNDTDIDFEQWSQTPYNHSAVDKELHIQKKRMFPESQKPPFLQTDMKQPVLKSMQRAVSFQDPVAQDMVAMEPVNQCMQQMNLGVPAN